jgi:UDP:flavonoid glycosyltransferase YjiC (YdhE family)
LTALRRPFLYFPIEGHSEQANVAKILEQRGAGVRMVFSKTTPALLAEKMVSLLGAEVTYPGIPADGARVAAQLLCRLLDQSGQPRKRA